LREKILAQTDVETTLNRDAEEVVGPELILTSTTSSGGEGKRKD